MEFIRREMDWELKANGRSILDCKGGKPMIYVGYGEESVDMYRGNYKIEDYVVERRPLGVTGIKKGRRAFPWTWKGSLPLRSGLRAGARSSPFTRWIRVSTGSGSGWMRTKRSAATDVVSRCLTLI